MLSRVFQFRSLVLWCVMLCVALYHGSLSQNRPSSPSTLDWGTSWTHRPADLHSSASMFFHPSLGSHESFLEISFLITEHSLCVTCNFRASYEIRAHVFFKGLHQHHSWPYSWHQLTHSCQYLIHSMTTQSISRILSFLSIITDLCPSVFMYIYIVY